MSKKWQLVVGGAFGAAYLALGVYWFINAGDCSRCEPVGFLLTSAAAIIGILTTALSARETGTIASEDIEHYSVNLLLLEANPKVISHWSSRLLKVAIASIIATVVLFVLNQVTRWQVPDSEYVLIASVLCLILLVLNHLVSRPLVFAISLTQYATMTGFLYLAYTALSALPMHMSRVASLMYIGLVLTIAAHFVISIWFFLRSRRNFELGVGFLMWVIAISAWFYPVVEDIV